MSRIVLSHCLQRFEVHSTFPEVVTTPRVMEKYTCSLCGRQHYVLYTIERKPRRPFGHFPVFAINGELTPIDATLPHDVDRLPRDAIRVEEERASRAWHGRGHYFTLPRE